MLNYLIADLNRIIHKKTFLYTVIGYTGLFVLMLFIVYNPTFNETQYISKMDMFLQFYPLVIGIPIFLAIYYDDFKSKSIQIGIGHGISRNKIVLTKAIVSAILAVISAVLLGVVILALPLLLGMSLSNSQLTELVLVICIGILKIIAYINLSTIFVYYSQNPVFGIISFVVLGSNTILMLLNIILGQEFVMNIVGDLTQHIYSIILNTQKSNFLNTGHFSSSSIIEIIAYIMAPIVISIILFRKKELEF